MTILEGGHVPTLRAEYRCASDKVVLPRLADHAVVIEQSGHDPQLLGAQGGEVGSPQAEPSGCFPTLLFLAAALLAQAAQKT